MASPLPAGTPVLHRLNPGYILLSYLTSVVGCWTTLEILERRTAAWGAYNWILLACSAITMNAVGIWSMHFVSNAALIMGNNTSQEQISYYLGWTIGSLVLPVFIVGIAFWLLSRAKAVGIPTVILGGLVCGTAICGMHYSGERGIANYRNESKWPYILGSAILACVVASVALGIFFMLKNRWKNTWWKRGITAALLAAGASSMHWVAIAGTEYTTRTVKRKPKLPLIRAGWICGVLSVACCFMLLLLVTLWHRLRRQGLKRSNQISLTLACMNPEGKILLNASGYLPSRKVTNRYIEQWVGDTFEVDHELFIWLFRASRNWQSVATLVPELRRRVNIEARQKELDDSAGAAYNTDSEYVKRLKEQLTVAVFDLRSYFHFGCENFGVLYDRIIETGTLEGIPQKRKARRLYDAVRDKNRPSPESSDIESGKSLTKFGRGQMLVLVRHVDWQTQPLVEARGFSFVPLSTGVRDSIARCLRISQEELQPLLSDIQTFGECPQMLQPGIYLACLATRAAFSISKFDILVQKQARNLLPAVKMELERLEQWQIELLEAAAGKDANSLRSEWSARYHRADSPVGQEKRFFGFLLEAMDALGAQIGEEMFKNLRLAPKPLLGPVSPQVDAHDRTFVAQVIAFYGFADIHHGHPKSASDVFLPANLVLAYQRVYPNSLHHVEFANEVRTEFDDIDMASAYQPRHSMLTLMEEHMPTVLRESILAPRLSSTKRHSRSQGSGQASPGASESRLGEREAGSSSPTRSYQHQKYLDVSVSQEVKLSFERAPSMAFNRGRASPIELERYGARSQVDTALVQPSMVDQLFEMALKSSRHRHLPGGSP